MSAEIELISDGDGVAVFGERAAIERFLSSAGVTSKPIKLTPAMTSALKTGSSSLQAASEVAASAGRWIKLTEKSAEALKLGAAMKGSSDGLSRAIVVTSKHKTSKILEFAKQGSVGSILTNPAVLTGAAGIMAQLAMQQSMEEISQYLAVIDEKVDDVLRAHKDAAVAEMIGVGLVIDEAMIKREESGRVSEVTWSNLHGAAQTIASTQAYALRQLDALAEKLEAKRKVADLAKSARQAEGVISEWLAVLARCFQLQDALAVLELDRVLDSSPDDVEPHRKALRTARQRRRSLIADTTEALLARLDAAAELANEKVLLHPIRSKEVILSGNEIGTDLVEFQGRLGITRVREELANRRWAQAAADVRDTVVSAASVGATEALRWANPVGSTVKTALIIAHQLHRRKPSDGEANERND